MRRGPAERTKAGASAPNEPRSAATLRQIGVGEIGFHGISTRTKFRDDSQIVTPFTGVKLYRGGAEDPKCGGEQVNWIPTFGGNMLGWVPTSVLIAVVLSLLTVIVVLVAAVKTQIEDEDQTNQPPPR
jgi:hypothetical protein